MPKAKVSTTSKATKPTAKTISKPKKETTKVKKTTVEKLENKLASSSPLSQKINLPSFSSFNIEDIKANLQKHQNRKTYAILVIVGLAFLLFYFKNWFIAATVNGSPISNFEVLSQLNKQYREQTLTQLVNEKIIMAEARKQGVKVTPGDIDNKLAEIEKNVGGPEVLETLLSQQGQTRDSVKDQLKLQITIEKMYINEATVSTQEVTTFIEQNKDQLKSTESAEQVTEATEILKQQKLSQIFNEKFTQLKQDAKITIF